MKDDMPKRVYVIETRYRNEKQWTGFLAEACPSLKEARQAISRSRGMYPGTFAYRIREYRRTPLKRRTSAAGTTRTTCRQARGETDNDYLPEG